jgi:hypothetical protein
VTPRPRDAAVWFYVADPELLVGVHLLRSDVVVRLRAVAGLLRPTRLRCRPGG